MMSLATAGCVKSKKVSESEPDQAIAGDSEGEGEKNDSSVLSTSTDNLEKAESPSAQGSNPALDKPKTYKKLDQPWSLDLVNEWVRLDQAKRGADAPFIKYTYLPEKFLVNETETNYARIGIAKALNSLAIEAEDIIPLEDISGHGLAFALDIRKFLSGDAATKWNWIAQGQPIALGGGGFQDLAGPLRLAAFDPAAVVPADRLAYNALHGGIYTALLDTPPLRSNLETQLGLGERTTKLAFEHGITFGIRYAERRTFTQTYKNGQTREGFYWITFDPFDPGPGLDDVLPWKENGGRVPTFNATGLMVDYRTNVATESYYSMKNGLFAYYVWGSNDQRRSRADPRFVVDPLHRDDANAPQDVVTGLCANCHVNGVQGAYNEMAEAIEKTTVTNQAAIDFWTPNGQSYATFQKDRAIFKKAMEKIILSISSGSGLFNEKIVEGSDQKEPIYYLLRYIGNHSGDTTGLRRRRADGVIPGLNGNVGQTTPSAPINRVLTFAADILPILSSTSPGKNYRCTLCHANFSNEANLSAATLDSIISTVTLQYMPVGTGTDKLGQPDIDVLKAWKKQKFGI